MTSLLPTQDSRALSTADVVEVKALQGFQNEGSQTVILQQLAFPPCDVYDDTVQTWAQKHTPEEAMNIAPGALGTLAFRGHQMLLPTHPSIHVL